MKNTAVLLIDCPDRRGLVAQVSSLLYKWGANILHADQHQNHDLGLFFMRVEWDLSRPADPIGIAHSASVCAQNAGPAFDLDGFQTDFTPLAQELGMNWKLTIGHRPSRVALFCSQYLHCLVDLL